MIFYFDTLTYSVQIALVIPSPVMELHTLHELEEMLWVVCIVSSISFLLSVLPSFLNEKAFFPPFIV